MTRRTRTTWTWELTDPGRSSSSGDVAKLFKNETVKSPGVFASNAPSEHATLMAREVIQNSADASAELVEELGEDAPELWMDFEFEALVGEHKDQLVDALDLEAIAQRGTNAADPSWRSKLGLDRDDALDHLHDGSPLRVLRIVESGTTGMYGSFINAKSKMYHALISLGYTKKGDGSGGSYGFGKAGVIRGSAIRTIVAYSCFRERDDDPGVTRRLLGVTYWGQHEIDDDSYTGFARFGATQPDESIHPFENGEADAVAERLGLELRTPDDPHHLGTTFLVIEPTVTAPDLLSAIARNWWPALEDGRITARVTDNGTTRMPRPMKDPILKTFVDAYHLATTDQDNPKPNQMRQPFRRASFEGQALKPGAIGLIADPGGWSYEPDPDDATPESAPRSLVALVRGPRMVVEYLDVGRSRPFVRGTFVADDEVDELLRQTEPKAHDSWQTRIDEPGIDPIAPQVADVVLRRVRETARRFRDSLRPATRPAEDVRLPELERLFGRIFTGSGGKTPAPESGERPFTISVSQSIGPVGDAVQLTGSVAFAVADHHEDDSVAVEVLVSYRFVEEGGAGEEASLTITAPAGFEPMTEGPYRFRGQLTRKPANFTFTSLPYQADWTGRLKADVELASEVEGS